MLYRVFAWDPATRPDPLAVPAGLQGGGRHDNPGEYVALYAARHAESAVAERIQAFRGRDLTSHDLVRADGRVLSLASLDDSSLQPLVDLDDAVALVRLARKPSEVATGDRRVTQPLALELFEAGATGLSWWSILEASWTNVTLFHVRLPDGGLPVLEVQPLSVTDPWLLAAADRLGIRISA